jgi:CheY-like chemotaxis protein
MSKPVIAAVDDMFFASKIRAVTEHLGVKVCFVRSADEALKAARDEEASLVVADLHSQRCDPLGLARQFKADANLRSVSLIGFFSHVETALQQKAKQAGFDRVMPRSAFSKNLSEIIRNADFGLRNAD